MVGEPNEHGQTLLRVAHLSSTYNACPFSGRYFWDTYRDSLSGFTARGLAKPSPLRSSVSGVPKPLFAVMSRIQYRDLYSRDLSSFLPFSAHVAASNHSNRLTRNAFRLPFVSVDKRATFRLLEANAPITPI